MIGSSFAQSPPQESDEQRANIVDLKTPTPQEMKNNMFRRMGPSVDYVKGANIAGFIKVADAMLACGLV